MNNLVHVRVWGNWACFTRPEMKVERVSYQLPTPSAARGILEAIFWEPEMYYIIDSIRVIKKGIWTSFKRNEVQKTISLNNVKKWMQDSNSLEVIIAGAGEDTSATPRNTLALQDVEYIISAEVHLTELGKKSRQSPQKYIKEFTSRAKLGKCFHRPYLGVREFAAYFELVEDPTVAHQTSLKQLGALKWNELLGLMLYDIFDHEDRAEGFRYLVQATKTSITTEGKFLKPTAYFFQAEIKDSVMDCHPSRVKIIRRNGGL
ncbi:MAG: type I-C CRISPR-associated protein Cas5c [Acidobacteriota bacterium]|nr:type I-C CRISPR-associated protein Cas5c [Blastocatellia bacterium]MDW8413026.1 type I-C CRISPR-associated protein Cas5c [Acidobacteriota bacterium]